MATYLTFLGAAETVTGSRTLVESGNHIVLVDCGMFQGARELRRRNWEPFGPDPAGIEAVLLTHAHLDHCGYLPALVRDGFAGPVFCTPNTADLVPIVLRDSAKLQEEDTDFARRKGFSRHADPQPLYNSADAEAAIALLHPVPFHADTTVAPGIVARFEPAGHILGSAVITLRAADGASVVFSGDLGRDSHPLLVEPAHPSPADAIVVESTYGDRGHADTHAELQRMADAITRTVKRGGTVVIPAFAVDRTEVILKALRDLQGQHRIPVVPIHVDSPMALAALRVYRDAIESGDAEIRSAAVAAGADAISPPNVHQATTPDESRALDTGGARIIVSASGMGTGGRVVHHLKAVLPDRRSTVILAGYQAVGTRGRMLLDGARELKIHGGYVPVRAEIVDVGAFSVHADADDLIEWLGDARPAPRQVFVNHGESDAAQALARRIRDELDIVAVVPRPGERIGV